MKEIIEFKYNLYKIFKPLVYELFDYANGKINPINKCDRITIDYLAKEQGMLGKTINGVVTIYLGEIINFVMNYKKYENVESLISHVATMLAATIFHELAHSEQMLYMEGYVNSEEYFNSIESSADLIAYQFLTDHAQDVADISGTDIIINANFLRDYNPNAIYHKLPNNYEFLYKLLILNSIIRFMTCENTPSIIGIIDGYDNVSISINNEKVVIKQYNIFIPDNYFVLRDILYRNVIKYEYINYSIKITAANDACHLDFKVAGIIEPISFEKEENND